MGDAAKAQTGESPIETRDIAELVADSLVDA
jgi:hypothetical protein